jgi:LysM repeat protein
MGREKMSFIYKHSLYNNKGILCIYIGQTNLESVEKRIKRNYIGCPIFLRHINKYGWENINTDILFEGECTQKELNNMEKFYIKHYKNCEETKSLNITEGGDHAPMAKETKQKVSFKTRGEKSGRAKITNQIAIEIADKLANTNLTYDEIAEQYNIPKHIIKQLNYGKSWTKILKIKEYPIRNTNKLNKTQINEIINLLKNTDLTYTEIAEKYNRGIGSIWGINNGEHYNNKNLEYPIRKNAISVGVKRSRTK